MVVKFCWKDDISPVWSILACCRSSGVRSEIVSSYMCQCIENYKRSSKFPSAVTVHKQVCFSISQLAFHISLYINTYRTEVSTLHKGTITHRHSSHNRTIFAAIHNVSTTRFDHFWCGRLQVGYNYQKKYITISYNTIISVIVSILCYVVSLTIVSNLKTAKSEMAGTCSWYVMYNCRYSCVMTAVPMRNCSCMC